MEREDQVGLALGLSLGSGHQPSRSSPPPCALEPSLSLSIKADDGSLTTQARPLFGAVKRELPVQDDDAAAGDDDEGCNNRKKLRLSKEQSALLEDHFKEHRTLNPKLKVALAKQLNLRPRQVEVWFQNRRARTKLKQTEVDCELLKRCCETLTEENRRLHRELQQLRALNPAAFFMPAAALSICPSCECLTGGAPAATVTDQPKPTAPGRAAPLFSTFTKSTAC